MLEQEKPPPNRNLIMKGWVEVDSTEPSGFKTVKKKGSKVKSAKGINRNLIMKGWVEVDKTEDSG